MYYVGFPVIHAFFFIVGLFELRVMNSLFCEVCNSRSHPHVFFKIFFPPWFMNNSVDLGFFLSAARFEKF